MSPKIEEKTPAVNLGLPEPTELVIAFVGAVGVNLAIAEAAIRQRLKEHGYDAENVKISEDVLPKLDPTALKPPASPFKRTEKLMEIGTNARNKYGPRILAHGVGCQITKLRAKISSKRLAFLVHSLKHPEEVHALREMYPRGFYLVGVHAHFDRRMSHLVRSKGMTEKEAESLVKRDKKEENEENGQQVSETFHLADFFVGWGGDDDLTVQDLFPFDDEGFVGPLNHKPNAKRVNSSVMRFVDLIFGNRHSTPTFGEYSMFLAFSASLRSADLSRQVGAVISRDGEILSTGANDCPRAGGGLYWPEFNRGTGEIADVPEGRDYMRTTASGTRGYDSNRFEQNELIDDLRSMIVDAEMDPASLAIFDKVMKSKQNPLYNLTEYGRVVHAEMEALLACARKGISTKGATIYCTTFPCHNCAKHIIAAGIQRVVFVEPYLKSKALEFHKDSVVIGYPQDRYATDETDEQDKRIRFEPFFGVGPRRFYDLFSMSLGAGEPIKRKHKETGEALPWPDGVANPRLKMHRHSYLDLEAVAAASFEKVIGA